jgi:hypothetical protein
LPLRGCDNLSDTEIARMLSKTLSAQQAKLKSVRALIWLVPMGEIEPLTPA